MKYIPSWCFDAIVTLGVPIAANQIQWVGTGSILRSQSDDQTRFYLVTAKHVASVATGFYIAFPNNQAILVQFRQNNVNLWRCPANVAVDIAVLPLPAATHARIIASFDAATNVGTVDWLEAHDVKEGVDCSIISGLNGAVANEDAATIYGNRRLAKRATVALNRATFADSESEMLFDGLVWQGSSGAPVVFVEQQPDGVLCARQIAVTSHYIPYPDQGTNLQNAAGQVRILFNSGIFGAFAIDHALDLIAAMENEEAG